MYPKDKNHFSVKNIFSINSNKKAFRVKQTNFEKNEGKMFQGIGLFFKLDFFSKMGEMRKNWTISEN